MQYEYICYTTDGREVKGRLEAPSEQAATDSLWRQGFTVAALKATSSRPTMAEMFPSFMGPKARDIVVLCRQLATITQSGIGILQALDLLSDQTPNSLLRAALQRVASAVRSGAGLPQAIEAQPDIFPTILGRLLRVAEQTGNFEMVLREVADYVERQEAITSRLRRASAYPIFVLVLSIGVVVLLMTVTLPTIIGIYEDFKGELPVPTKILIGMSSFLTNYGVTLAVIIASVIAVLYGLISRTAGGHLRFQAFLLKAPIFGGIILKADTARLCRTCSSLLKAGVPLSDTIALASQSVGNEIIRLALARVRNALMEGVSLSRALAAETVFPRMLVQMAAVGEETGALDANLEGLARFYEEETDRAVSTLLAMLEPATTIGLAAVVAFIALSLIMPLYGMSSIIK